jgi:hypothetical protein
LRHLDIVTLRVGVPIPWTPRVKVPGEEQFVREAGVSPTQWRRGLADMRDGGYVTSHQPRTRYLNAEGEEAYCAHFTIHCISEKFFDDLGLTDRLKKERGYRSAAIARRPKRVHPGPLLRGQRDLRLRKRPMRNRDRDSRLPPAASPDAAANDNRRRNEIMLTLRQKHPEWPSDRIREEALQQLRLELGLVPAPPEPPPD